MSHPSNALPELSALQEEFIEWLVDPERQGSEKQWARDHGINEATKTRWKHSPFFRRGLQRRMDELNLSPDRVQAVLNNMHRLATSSGREAVMAAKTYLQHVERLEPTRKPIEDRAIKDLTHEELLEQLERALDNQRRSQVKVVGE
jgi:hypothetical protein